MKQDVNQAGKLDGADLRAQPVGGLSLRAKVVLVAFIATITPLLAGAFHNYYTTLKAAEHTAQDNLRTLALRTAKAYDDFIQSNLATIRSEAQMPVFRAVLARPAGQFPTSPVLAEAGATLAVLAHKNRISIDAYLLADSSGTILADSNGSAVGTNKGASDWFTQAWESGQAYVSPVRTTPDAGEASMYFASPVLDPSGKRAGVICAKYKAAVLQQLLCNAEGLAGPRSFAMLLDSAGICLAHNSSSAMISQPLTTLTVDQHELQRGLALAGSDAPFFTAHLEPARDYLSNAAVALMETQPWVVICAQPQEVYLDPLNNQLRLGLVLGLGVITLLLILALEISRTVTAPVVRLSQAARRLSAGSLGARARVESRDEIGVLATSFNTMAAQLQQVVEDLELRNTALTGLNARLRMIVESVGKLAQRPPPFQLGAILLEELGRSLGCSGGSLYLRQGDRLLMVHTLDPGHAAPSLPFPPPAGSFFQRAIEHGQAMLINDIGSQPKPQGAGWSGYTDGSLIVFPLLDSHRDCLGLVSLHNKLDPPLLAQDRELGALVVATGTETLQATQAAEALVRSQERYRRLVELAQEGIITADAEERINFVNPVFADTLGYSAAEILGHDLQEFCEPTCVAQLSRRVKERHAGLTSSYELTLLTKSGEQRVFNITASPLYDEEGRFEGSLGVCTDITERKHAEQALRDSEAKYRGYIDHAPDAVAVIDGQARILEMNQAGLDLIGYTLEEARQLTILDLAPPERKSIGAVKIKHLVEQGKLSIDAIMQRKDGQRRHIWMTGIRLAEDRFLGFAKDITELKNTELELAEKHAYLESIFAALTDRVLVLNRELKIADANRAFLQSTRLRFDALGELHCWEIGACPGRQVEQECLSCPARLTFQDGKVHQVSHQTSDASGLTTYWEITSSPALDANGAMNSVVLVVRDVTVERRLEQQVREAQKMEAIGRLAGGIAHDFNNILAAITAYTDLALAELPLESSAASDIREVKRGARRAAELIKQILTFSRRGEQERRPVRLKTIIAEVLRLMRASLPAFIELQEQFDIDQDLILADPTQMHQVLMNLMTNAGQAMNERGGVITVRLSEVSIISAAAAARHALAPGSYLVITIIDQGRGIAPEALEHVFEPFYTTKPVGQGTGLGLAVAHGIITNHRGAIEIQSTLGQGTKVQVYLPKVPAALEVADASDSAEASGTERIMLVDDEEALIQVGERALTRLGYRVTGFTSSREALRAFRQAPDAFDVVVTDQTMPHLSGSELATAVLHLRPEIPVVLCTGYSESMPQERAEELGIALYMQKPYGMRELGAAIRSVIDGAARPLSQGDNVPA